MFKTIILEMFTNKGLIGVVSSSISLILIGIYSGKKRLVPGNSAEVLSNIVLTISIPALCITAFLQDFNYQLLLEGRNLLIWSFLIHLILMGVGKLFFLKFEEEKQTTLEILTVFGGVTVFGIPIVQALFGNEGIVYASVYSIAYRIFLYSYGYIKMADLKISKKNLMGIFLNPVVLATFVSLILWIFQEKLPQINVEGNNFSIFRLDKTAYWIYRPLLYLAALCSPLAWLATGLKLSEIAFIDSLKSIEAWYYSILKVVVIPLFFYMLIMNVGRLGVLPISKSVLKIIMIMLATPAASVVVAYAIKFKKGSHLASVCSLLSTIVSLSFLPFLIIILN